jgi:hypothetical protein
MLNSNLVPFQRYFKDFSMKFPDRVIVLVNFRLPGFFTISAEINHKLWKSTTENSMVLKFRRNSDEISLENFYFKKMVAKK